jgi:hypothetical protein
LGTRIFVEDVLDQVASGMGSNPVSPIHWLFLDLIFPTPEHIDIDVRASGRLAHVVALIADETDASRLNSAVSFLRFSVIIRHPLSS